ncbi:Sugar transporter STL1 [Choanephora cucurbitarum]|uniref:Sugar transporter STL1 n=1 Tax=Choanephora cucurbitarum TaxID=101091 RepID=A0A1C7N6T9_9FUNG|nr:Sugar transporter STL1 [Choanephora cucurbitarum]
MFKLQGKALFNASTLLAATGFLLFGYDQGVMSGIVPNQHFLDLMGNPNSAVVGAMVALYEIGCMFGALNLAMTIAFRIVTGVGNGMNTATVPVYQSEVSPPKSRGAHVCFECALIVAGVGIAYWLEYGLHFVGGEVAWRFPLAFQIFFALILIAGTFFLPETPRWLVAHDRDDDAKEVLARLWSNGDVTHVRCVSEYEEIKQSIEAERREGVSSYRVLFSKGKFNNRKRVLIAMLSQIIQQLGGINVTTYYLTDVMIQAGMTYSMAMLMAGIDAIVYFIGACLPIFIVERVGRRKIMLWGLAAQAVTLVWIGGAQKANTDNPSPSAANAAVAGTILYNFVFGCSWLGMSWLYPAEIFSTGLRAKGNSLSTAANWIGNFIVAMIAPVLFEYITFWTYILFAFMNLLFFPMVYFWFPETKGLSLEQVDILFATEDVKNDIKSVDYDRYHNHNEEKADVEHTGQLDQKIEKASPDDNHVQ